MALVPKYQPNVAERPLMQQSITVQANANDFGAQIGAGMQNLAQGGMQASEAFRQIADMEDTAYAKEADNNLAAWMRERQYGEGGFMTLSGKAAVDGRQAYETELAEKRGSFGEGLRPGAAQKYGQASNARVNSALESSIVHAARERKTWFGEATAARLDTFADDALAAWSNPAAVTKNIALGQAELRQQAQMMGWDADTLANKEAGYISGVRTNVAFRTMSDDPIAAKAYIDQHRQELSGADQFKLDEALEIPLANAEGMKAASEFLGVTTREPVGNAGQGPTRARAVLMERSVNPRAAHIDGLDGSFVNNLAALMEDAPFEGLGVLSGNRTQEEQIALFEGSDKTGHSVAFPIGYRKPDGSISNGSNHQHGNAVDISYNGKSLKHAPKEVLDWVHANAGKYGMTFPMDWENWHIEPVNARGGSTAVAATGSTVPRATAPSRVQVEQYLAGIADPRAREVARSSITANLNAQAEDAKAQRIAVQEAAFSDMITQDMSPYSMPPEVQTAIGREGMSSLMSYWDKVSAGEKIETNPELLYSMQTAYASDPAGFAEVDLMQYRAQMSDEDWKTVTGWRQTALTDARKAGEDGTAITTAFAASSTALEAAGITTTGKKDGDRVEAAKQIAMFQNVLAQELEASRQANDGRPLNPIETQALINRLLLPVVIKPVNKDDGIFGNHLFGLGLPSDQAGFLFQAGSRPDNTVVDVAVEYKDVPIDLRTSIRSDLEASLGRIPTEQEIADEYEAFLLGQ